MTAFTKNTHSTHKIIKVLNTCQNLKTRIQSENQKIRIASLVTNARFTNEKSKKLLMFDVWRHPFAFTCVRLQEPGLAGGGRNADQSF